MLYSITSYDDRGCSISSPPIVDDIVQYGIFEGLENTLKAVELILKQFIDELKEIDYKDELEEYTDDEIRKNFNYETEEYKKTLVIAELDGKIGEVLKQKRFAKFKKDGTLKWSK